MTRPETEEIDTYAVPVPESLISPAPDRVREQLAVILASRFFFRSDRLSALFTKIVELSLQGQRQYLTERSLGISVFAKDPGWDPREDTIVRSEARRLRRKLKEFYEDCAVDTLVVIDIPVGAYIASFLIPAVAKAETKPANKHIDVADPPLRDSDDSALGQRGYFSRGKRLGFALVSISAVIVCFIGIALLSKERMTAKQASSFDVLPFATEIGEEYSPTVSPNDKWLAYVWDGNKGEPNIYVQDVGSGMRRKITTGEGRFYLPAWSPDGKRLSFLRDRFGQADILIKDIGTGAEQVVSTIRREEGRWSADSGTLLGNVGPEWSPDGRALLFADRLFADAGVGGIYRVELSGGARRQITVAAGEQRDFSPRVSPDGKTLAFVRYFSHGHGELFTVSVDGGQPHQLTHDNRDIQGLSWSKEGKSLIFCSNRKSFFQLWTMPYIGGEAALLATNTTSATSPASFHHSSTVAFVDASENWNIWRYPITVQGLGTGIPLLSSSGRNHDPRYSPDGRHIAWISDRSGTLEVWLSDADGLSPRQVTHFGGVWVNSINWSPDGKTIAVDARPLGHAAVYAVEISLGATRLLDDAPFEQRMPAWSVDATSIYFNSVRDGAVAVYKRSLQTGIVNRVSEHEMYMGAESVDGLKLFFSDRSGGMYEGLLDGSRVHPLGIHVFPVKSWEPSAHGFVYSTASVPNGSTQILEYNGDTSRLLGSPSKPLVTNDPDLSPSPDGHWLLVAQQDMMRSDIKLRTLE